MFDAAGSSETINAGQGDEHTDHFPLHHSGWSLLHLGRGKRDSEEQWRGTWVHWVGGRCNCTVPCLCMCNKQRKKILLLSL